MVTLYCIGKIYPIGNAMSVSAIPYASIVNHEYFIVRFLWIAWLRQNKHKNMHIINS